MKSIEFKDNEYVKVYNIEDAKLVNDYLRDRDGNNYTAKLSAYEKHGLSTKGIIIYGHNGFDSINTKVNSSYKKVSIDIFKQNKELVYEIY